MFYYYIYRVYYVVIYLLINYIEKKVGLEILGLVFRFVV